MIDQSVTVAVPDYIFAVTYAENINKKFDQLRGDRRIMYACHGSRLENFHSILHSGLHGHLSKVSYHSCIIPSSDFICTIVGSSYNENCYCLFAVLKHFQSCLLKL